MSSPAHRPPVNHPATIGSRCKRCGGALVRGKHYVIVKESSHTGTAQDSLCLACLGLLLLTSDEFIEAFSERLLEVMDKRKPPEEDPSGG